jgi:dTDP-4-amino-4,6-dideoxygalactose transaminase
VTFQLTGPDCLHVYQIFSIRVPPELRDPLVDRLRREGVEAKVYFNFPIHLQTFYRERGYHLCTDNLVETENAATDSVALPMYPSLTVEEIRRVACVVEEVLG